MFVIFLSVRASNILSDEFVRKFRIIVNSNSLDVFLIGLKLPSDFLNQRFCLLPMGKFGHEMYICKTLHNRKYGVVVSIHN